MNNLTSLSKNDLLLCFEDVLISSGFVIYNLEMDKNTNFYKFVVNKNKKEFVLFVNISNINEAYIPNKPFIKRRQIGALVLDNIPQNTGNQFSMLCGIKKVDEEIVLCVWNPFYFTNHTKNRSCYVVSDSIYDALKNGIHFGIDCKNTVYLCNRISFEKLFDEYILKNRID